MIPANAIVSMSFQWTTPDEEVHSVSISMDAPELAGPRAMLIMMANQAVASEQPSS